MGLVGHVGVVAGVLDHRGPTRVIRVAGVDIGDGKAHSAAGGQSDLHLRRRGAVQ
jgi:hypothetical protein